MSITLQVEWTIGRRRLRARATVHNGSEVRVAMWTALRRIRLDGALIHGDPRWAFADVEGGVMHLRRQALGPTNVTIPGVVPPDLFLVEPGADHIEWLDLPVPLEEMNPIARQERLEARAQDAPCESTTVQGISLTLGYLVVDGAVAASLTPLGAHLPGVFRLRRGGELFAAQRLLKATERLAAPIEARAYASLEAAGA